MSSLLCEANCRVQDSQLLKIDHLIDWNAITKLLGNLGRSGYGPNGYSPRQLLKGLMLQSWHNLSGPGLEEAIRLRLDFMIFTGFEENVPDETTFCKFRNKLIELDLLAKVLDLVNEGLARQGMEIKAASGAIIDATIIESAARPRKEIDGIAIDRREDESIEVVCGDTSL